MKYFFPVKPKKGSDDCPLTYSPPQMEPVLLFNAHIKGKKVDFPWFLTRFTYYVFLVSSHGYMMVTRRLKQLRERHHHVPLHFYWC